MTVLGVFQPWKSQELSPHGSDRTDYAARTAMETESEEQHGGSADDESAAAAEAVLKEMSTSGKQQPNLSSTAREPSNSSKSIVGPIKRFRNLCGAVINNTRVQILIILLIAVNAIMMGIATFPFVKDNPQVNHKFEVTDQVFLIIFTVELFMQFVYRGFHLFLDGWLVFDFVIILMSWSFSEVQIIRAFRIFRAFRLITRVKVLQNLIVALFGVVPRMAAIGLLLLLIFFIFAILMTSMWKDLWFDGDTSQDYFSRLDATFFTLFQIMTLDEWAGIAREVMVVQHWAWLPIITFVIITAFVVINLIIAVICDAISALHADQKAMIHGQRSTDMGEEESMVDPDDLDIKKQLQTLEQQIEELSRMQEQTMHSLQYLTRHLQAKKIMKKSK